ncbi:MAG: aldehyde dehydrogenase family protein, partial [Roseibacillus sp.]|nr:aldehyde dehydrogenase family protein [Roseibacillus sp.]
MGVMAGTKQQETVSPVDGSVYATRQLAGKQQWLEALVAAEEALHEWKKIPVPERAAVCSRMVDAFVARKESIAEEISWMMGRPIRYAAGEVAGFEERARHMISIAETALAPVEVEPREGFRRYIKRDHKGVVAVIAPWNYPYLTAVNAVVPALLAGNTVILKHSAQTPLCAERFYEAFEAAGLPKGVFQYLHLSHEDTTELIRSEQVQHVCFTGSVAGGATVEKAVAGRFISLGLELGGKDPAYVRADADLDAAVETLVDGAFFNSGQSCCGIERIYVDAEVHDAFVAKAVKLTRQYKLGRPDDPETTLGPLVKPSAAAFAREQVEDALARGATAHIDSSLFPAHDPSGAYMAPQILTGVDHSMRVMTEETFGPVVGIQKTFSDEEAVGLMNDSEFGLTASVFTRDIERAVELGEQIETGTFFTNR